MLCRCAVFQALLVVLAVGAVCSRAIATSGALRHEKATGLAALNSCSTADGSPASQQPAWRQRLELWVQAVNDHNPGHPDTPALMLSLWSEADLEEVRTNLFALVAIHKRLRRPENRAPVATYKDTRLTVLEIQALLGMTDDEATRTDVDRVLKRGAILHADVAMLVIPTDLGGQVGCSARPTVMVVDGTRVGSGCVGIHWVHARTLLDAVTPDPREDREVRSWYQATLAFLLERGDFANALNQIEHGRLLFPRDPGILFECGYYYESFASPYVLPAAHASGADRRSEETLLEQAEALFREAVKVNPAFVEAQVHWGRVLLLLGRHAQAAEVLRRATPVALGSQLRYYAELFLGQAEQSAGNRDAAREHFDAAARLYPLAQSPRLALGLLAREGGNRADALQAMVDVLAIRDKRDRADPWWIYYGWHNENAEFLLRALYRPYLAEDSR